MFDDPSTIQCPECGTPEPLEIIYGLPSAEMSSAEAQGLIAFGGCIIEPESPAYRCRNDGCDTAFGSL
jgi:hypothetical protein